ncbi:MAG TPA: glycoside hydrolase family 2 TIM barrel-domain containing protein [Candidatus Dormibacteraeota bacterium]|nr:glycoside hydrolase family 2 TIM barrel-domain containing protein [Candidatus Dormibacteraeota bacterium]
MTVRPTAAWGRQVLDLDGIWAFVADPRETHTIDQLPAGVPISVPGSWEAQLPGRFGIVTGWYRRNVEIPADWTGGTVLITFGAVMLMARIWLNGILVGDHEGGYTPFEIDITGALHHGVENQLVVRVSSPLNALRDYPTLPLDQVVVSGQAALPMAEVPHGKQTWYTSLSGIWQSVQMECLTRPALRRLQVWPDLPNHRVRVSWSVRAANEPASLRLRVIDPSGQAVAEQEIPVPPDADGGETSLDVPSPRPWGIGAPNVYRLRAQLFSQRGARDELSMRFGMRSIEARDGDFLLNDEPIYLSGALDQDVFPDGMSVPGNAQAYYREQFQRVKEMGLNLVRCHIKVPDPAYLDAADEAGVLLWCELPSWSRFSTAAASRGKATLQAMVEAMAHHPSIVIWTIINEDWGTRLQEEARDRRWLLEMYDWLKQLDPTRLVVDNSACDTSAKPNFHLATDIADFHAYSSMPDGAVRWRNLVGDMVRRPAWLWSPYGDARPRGDEPLMMSEFGNWGLPDISRMRDADGTAPWWFETGRQLCRPGGVEQRFHDLGLGRIWRDWPALAAATQWRQFEALQYEIGELRRHPEIRGHVITELTDAYWEANGLLDLARGRKVFHDRLAELNGPTVLIADLPRRDYWGGDEVTCEIVVASPATHQSGLQVTWTLTLDGGHRVDGVLPIASLAARTHHSVRLRVSLPEVAGETGANLGLSCVDAQGSAVARGSWSLAVLPSSRKRTGASRHIAIEDPLGIWKLDERLRELGHQRVARDGARLLITTELTAEAREFADGGGRVLLLVRSRAAVPGGVALEREVRIWPRRMSDPDCDPPNPWEGDWISTFNWILPGRFPDLPERNPLDFAYQEVIPDHVLRGYQPLRHADEVPAGVFVAWLHAPAALLWTFRQGRGEMTITTLKLSPECGPVATVLLEDLIQGEGS